ncbi:MAG: hypothetical protein LC121_10675 [Anaerolineae bacterium]|nr:hypothetical protein [Anaerolineae bacterium]
MNGAVVANEVPDLSRWFREGDTVVWGQAAAEPTALTRALVARREAFGQLTVFVGIGFTDTLRPEHADRLRMLSYGAIGRHRDLGVWAAERRPDDSDGRSFAALTEGDSGIAWLDRRARRYRG